MEIFNYQYEENSNKTRLKLLSFYDIILKSHKDEIIGVFNNKH